MVEELLDLEENPEKMLAEYKRISGVEAETTDVNKAKTMLGAPVDSKEKEYVFNQLVSGYGEDGSYTFYPDLTCPQK